MELPAPVGSGACPGLAVWHPQPPVQGLGESGLRKAACGSCQVRRLPKLPWAQIKRSLCMAGPVELSTSCSS